MLDPAVRAVLRDPVTLEPLSEAVLQSENGFLDVSVGSHTRKNLAELGFALDDYAEPDGGTYRERLGHMVHPDVVAGDIVVDIGCGPRSFLDGLPGHHLFVDDLIGAYVEQLDSSFDGLALNARTELLPLADDSVDVLYSINMLDHVDDLPATLAEIHRVVRPDGVVALQTYFNSHPLLASEPGVVDRFAFDTLIEPLFTVAELRTHEVESPEISDYYTMGIMTALLSPRVLAVEPIDRTRYLSPDYLGPQSRITEAISNVSAGEFAAARQQVDALRDLSLIHI